MAKRLGRNERIRGDELVGVVIHICMEISHGSFLCSYPYLKLAKMSCFSSVFFLYSSAKSENRRVEQVPQGQG
jgi:hypothetical protein